MPVHPTLDQLSDLLHAACKARHERLPLRPNRIAKLAPSRPILSSSNWARFAASSNHRRARGCRVRQGITVSAEARSMFESQAVYCLQLRIARRGLADDTLFELFTPVRARRYCSPIHGYAPGWSSFMYVPCKSAESSQLGAHDIMT